MENRKMNVDRWVDGRLAMLEPARGWRPDVASALVRVRERDRVYHVRRRRWAWVAIAASVASLTVLSVPGRCDSPTSNSCGQPLAGRIWNQVFPKPAEVQPRIAVTPVPSPVAAVPPAPVPAPAVTVAQNRPTSPSSGKPAPAVPASSYNTHFKEFGSPTAPITVEVYTDYECPACAVLYQQAIPMLVSQYVQTGKVKMLHRDFPLTQHPYARLAARFANAAGRLGQYDVVVNHLFQTQNDWSANGNVDRAVAQVLAPGVMQQVRAMVQNDNTLDDTVNADAAMGMSDRLTQTPTLVVVSKGKRQVIAGVPEMNLLQTYLNQLLAK
jgi:protein-disulfide isomerase